MVAGQAVQAGGETGQEEDGQQTGVEDGQVGDHNVGQPHLQTEWTHINTLVMIAGHAEKNL